MIIAQCFAVTTFEEEKDRNYFLTSYTNDLTSSQAHISKTIRYFKTVNGVSSSMSWHELNLNRIFLFQIS